MKFQNLAVLVLFLFSTIGFSQTRLNRAKQDLNKDKSSPSSYSSSSSSDNDDSDFWEILLLEAFIEPVVYVGGFVSYGLLIETKWEREGQMHFAEFTPYPYANGKSGNFMYEPEFTDENLTPVRFDINNSLVKTDSKLYGNHLNLDFRFEKRFSINAGYLQLFEESLSGKESFSLFNVSFNYYRIRTPRFVLWYGPGVSYVANDVNRFGFTLNVGAEWFIANPISLFANHKHAFLGSNSIDVFESRLKYHLNRYNISGGYERYQLGKVPISNFGVGVGVSF